MRGVMHDNMAFNSIGAECLATSCHKTATHTVSILRRHAELGDMTTHNSYCLDDAMWFAAWLPYCYAEMELVDIQPPASELFKR